jgi:hypothetical protein
MLLTVLFLDLFESLTAGRFRPQSESAAQDTSESRHLQGAIALVKLRGRSQFEDPISICMFHHISWCVLERCLKSLSDIPEAFRAVHTAAARAIREDDVEWHLEKLAVKVCGLKFEKIEDGQVSECFQLLEDDYRNLHHRFVQDQTGYSLTCYEGLAVDCGMARITNKFRLVREALNRLRLPMEPALDSSCLSEAREAN